MANEYTYRADHIGTLVTPAALSDARTQYGRGDIDLERLREAEDAAVKSAVGMQRSAGMAVTSDGGFRRAGGAMKLDGSTLAKHEAAPLRSLSRGPIKVAVPAPRPAVGEPRDQALARAGVVKAEIEALIAAGVDYVQLDAPDYQALFGDQPSAAGDINQGLDDVLRLDVAALSGIEPPDHVRIAVHFVPPTDTVPHAIVGAPGAAERVFQALPADRFLLPLIGAGRAFDVLRRVPNGKRVVLGLVSATTSALEDVDDLMAAIDQAAKLIDGDDLALSPATGFVAGDGMSEADQRRKLELIADVATRWWGFAM